LGVVYETGARFSRA